GAADHPALAFVNRVVVTRDGAVWALTAGGGVVELRGGRVETLPAALEALGTTNVSALLEDRAGTLWLGTNGRGLARYAEGRLSFLGAADGLGEVVYTLLEDQEGSIWVGTNGA